MNGGVPNGVLAAVVLAAGLAGCTANAGHAGYADDPGALDGREAFELAMAEAARLDPDAHFLGILGAEGTTLVPMPGVPRGLDDGLDDGVPSDGQVSSWVAMFRFGRMPMTIQVFASGLDPVVTYDHDLLDSGEHDGDARDVPWTVSSAEAAHAAARHPAFRDHTKQFPSATTVYAYSPGQPMFGTLGWRFTMADAPEDLEGEDDTVSSNAWSILRVPSPVAGAWGVAYAVVDAVTGEVGAAGSVVPRVPRTLYQGGEYEDPVRLDGQNEVHQATFIIPEGASNLQGTLFADAVPSRDPTRQLSLGRLGDEVIVRIRDPEGYVVSESRDGRAFVEVAEPQAGLWIVEATHQFPVPAILRVSGSLDARVPYQA